MAEVTTNTTTANPPSIATGESTTTATHAYQEARARPDLQTLLHHGRRLALRRARVGAAPGADHRLAGRHHLRAEGRRGPQGLVDDGDQHCRQQISARPARHARARDRRAPARDPRRRDHSRLGHQGRILPHRRRRGHLPRRARPPAVAAEGGVQFAGMVQRGLRSHRAQLRRAELALESAGAARRIRRVGYTNPQCSACFINSVHDSLDSILTLAKTEGMLFKWGSGTGTNLSPLRSSTEVALRRRHRQRPAQLHERLRRLRRRHQVAAARRVAPPRWSSSTSTIPTSSTSSSASRRKKPRPGRWSSTATTAAVPTARPTRPSSSRTPTTRCA